MENMTNQKIQKIIDKIEREMKFQHRQKLQVKEYESRMFKDEIIFARYDQSVKILKWVLSLLKSE